MPLFYSLVDAVCVHLPDTVEEQNDGGGDDGVHQLFVVVCPCLVEKRRQVPL